MLFAIKDAFCSKTVKNGNNAEKCIGHVFLIQRNATGVKPINRNTFNIRKLFLIVREVVVQKSKKT